MNSKSAYLILEICKLGLTALLIVFDGGFVKGEALTGEVCHCSVKEVGSDADMSAFSGALGIHKFEFIACED